MPYVLVKSTMQGREERATLEGHEHML